MEKAEKGRIWGRHWGEMDDSGRDHRISTWRQGCPKLWKSRPNRRLGLSCGGLKSFWSGKWCDNATTLEKFLSFFLFWSFVPYSGWIYCLCMCFYLQSCSLFVGNMHALCVKVPLILSWCSLVPISWLTRGAGFIFKAQEAWGVLASNPRFGSRHPMNAYIFCSTQGSIN